MAAITKIRQNSGLVLIVIGLGMGAFIMGDMFRGGGGREAQYVGEIAGEKIDRLDFENRVNIQLESLRSINQSPDAATIDQIRNQVWNQILREHTVMVELKEAGISVSQDEYDDVRWGDNVIPSFRSDPNFNPDGQFNPDAVKQYFSFISKQYPLYAQVQQKQIIESRETSKYYKAIASGLKSNNLESLEMARSNDSKLSFDFVYKRFNTIPDSIVIVSESDLDSYYHEHKGDKKYKQNESRNVSFVTYNVVASEGDKEFLKKDIALLIRDFETAESDSVFVIENADTKTGYNQIFIEGSVTNPKIDSMIVNAAIGDVIGPYLDRNSYKIAKVTGENFEEQARVRHILLKTTGINDDQIEQRADSIKNVIRRQRNFEEMVTTYSEDVASIKDGGVYEWFPQGRMVVEFNDAVFDGKKGDLVVVKTSYGYHIIEILGQREQRQPIIAIVDHEIVPSPDTFNEVYTEATDFSINNNDEASFVESAKEFDMNVTEANRVLKGSKNVSGVTDASEFVRWIYQADLNEVSSPIEIGDKFIVAVITKITKEGEPELDDVKDLFKGLVILDKKKELIIAEMEGITDLDELATSLSLQVQTANSIPYSSNTIPGGGSGEDEVIGEAFTLEVGDVSVPLPGVSGVYVIEITDKQMPSIDDLDSELFADDINLKYETLVNSGVFSALRDDADVVDNRVDFY
jgi:peptidyl-prolyl cis-trans isomerase D